ncbi:hypothetical protein HY733_02530, partial [Candidatus Uhrbacteria bacterium]|nr:hypothetical protein [Candidatus Uhrbacteria bacterium]
LSSTGTGADALQVSSSAGGIDITVAGAAAGENLDLLSNEGITITSTKNMTTSIVIDADNGASQGIQMLVGNQLIVAGDTNAGLVTISDSSPSNAVMDIDGLLEINLSNSSSDEAVCSNPDSEDATLNLILGDCSAAPTDDYAERYPTASDVNYGDIVVPGSTIVSTNGNGAHGVQQISQAVRSSSPYQGPVLGIISNNYGDFTSAGNNIADADRPMPVALVGRVPVKVVAEGGSIAVGDFLTTSSTPGAAMKATQAGRVIGMALANWDGTSPTVMVQVINTWYQPPTSGSSSLQGGSSGAVVVADSVTASDASFEGSVTVAEHLYGSHDMAGRIRMASQETSVRVTFETPYEYLPIVTFSSRSNSLDAREAWISNEDETGFTLNRPESTSDSQVEFNWIAVGVEDAQVTVSDLNGGFVQISVTAENGPSAPAPALVEEEQAVPAQEEVAAEEPVVEEVPAEEPVAEEAPASEAPVEEPVL